MPQIYFIGLLTITMQVQLKTKKQNKLKVLKVESLKSLLSEQF